MKQTYFNKIQKADFSILANYGDLSAYNYDQLCLILRNWRKRLIKGNGFFDADWEDDSTRIRIRYNNTDGHFIQIIEEEWKPLKMLFARA